MTKEEYKQLLQSDYWKGYSYSLIKERDFTCEDCGKRFYNERNKLQVHHLVYRDVNPWSYKPEEVVVLCEECHKKRHGIICATMPIQGTLNKSHLQNSSTKNYSEIKENVIKRDYEINNRHTYTYEQNNNFPKFILICTLILLALLIFTYKNMQQENTDTTTKTSDIVQQTDNIITEIEDTKNTNSKTTTHNNSNINNVIENNDNSYIKNKTEERIIAPEQIISPPARTPIITTHQDNPQRPNIAPATNTNDHSQPTKRIEDISNLSDLDIIERRNYEEVVKRAKQAGVSTEGSTLDILERMNHADVVKRAKQAGVSTEGSTLDILERIHKKEMGKYNQ